MSKKKTKVPIQPLAKFSEEPTNITIEGFDPPLWWSEEYGLDFEVLECLNYDFYKTVESLERSCEYGSIKKDQCKLL